MRAHCNKTKTRFNHNFGVKTAIRFVAIIIYLPPSLIRSYRTDEIDKKFPRTCFVDSTNRRGLNRIPLLGWFNTPAE